MTIILLSLVAASGRLAHVKTDDLGPGQYVCFVQDSLSGERCGVCVDRLACDDPSILQACAMDQYYYQEGLDVGTEDDCKAYVQAVGQAGLTDEQLQNVNSGIPRLAYAIARAVYTAPSSPRSVSAPDCSASKLLSGLSGQDLQDCVNEMLVEKGETWLEQAACDYLTDGIAAAFCNSGLFQAATKVVNTFANKYIEKPICDAAKAVEDAVVKVAKTTWNWFTGLFHWLALPSPPLVSKTAPLAVAMNGSRMAIAPNVMIASPDHSCTLHRAVFKVDAGYCRYYVCAHSDGNLDWTVKFTGLQGKNVVPFDYTVRVGVSDNLYPECGGAMDYTRSLEYSDGSPHDGSFTIPASGIGSQSISIEFWCRSISNEPCDLTYTELLYQSTSRTAAIEMTGAAPLRADLHNSATGTSGHQFCDGQDSNFVQCPGGSGSTICQNQLANKVSDTGCGAFYAFACYNCCVDESTACAPGWNSCDFGDSTFTCPKSLQANLAAVPATEK